MLLTTPSITRAKYVQEYRLLQKDGNIRWVEVRGECLYRRIAIRIALWA